MLGAPPHGTLPKLELPLPSCSSTAIKWPQLPLRGAEQLEGPPPLMQPSKSCCVTARISAAPIPCCAASCCKLDQPLEFCRVVIGPLAIISASPKVDGWVWLAIADWPAHHVSNPHQTAARRPVHSLRGPSAGLACRCVCCWQGLAWLNRGNAAWEPWFSTVACIIDHGHRRWRLRLTCIASCGRQGRACRP